MSNKLRKPKVSAQIKKENPYERFKFSRNPFPKSPGVKIGSEDPRENGSIYCQELVKDEEKQFEKLLIPKPSKPETNIIAFLMDYATRRGRGIGKTAFLNYVKNRIMKDFGENLSDGEHVIFAVYVSPVPGENYNHFWKISRLIINQLLEQNIIIEAICRLKAFTGLIPDKVLSEAGDDLAETLGSDSWLQEKGFENTFELNHTIKSTLEKLDIDAELAEILAFAGSSISGVSRYFSGLSDAFWRKNGNRVLFSDLIKLFQEAGFTKGIILFDELEKVFSPLNRKERRTFIDAIRYYFIDGDLDNAWSSFFEVLFTIHPYLQELMVPHWEAAGLDRFASIGGDSAHYHTIYFRPIQDRFAIPLAKAYLQESRLKDPGTDELFPFDEKALQEALKISNNVPGFYLSFLHTVIEKALEEKAEKITIETVRKTANTESPVEPGVEEKIEPLPKPLKNLKEE
jgi:hypothetical protein